MADARRSVARGCRTRLLPDRPMPARQRPGPRRARLGGEAMTVLATIMRRALVSGSAAGSAAAIAAAARAPAEGSTPFAPLNAVTHSLWPRLAFSETGPSVRFT